MEFPNRFSVRAIIPVACAAALLVGCRNEAKDTPKQHDPTSEMRFIHSTKEKVALGRSTFGLCVGCHGANGEGKIGVGPRIVSESYLAAASDKFLVDTITNGRAGTTMVPWGAALGRHKIEALVAYLRSLKPTEPAMLDERPLAGKVEAGAQVFRSTCSGCHGRSGAGYQETSNGTGIGRAAFLQTASNGFMRYIVRNGKSQTKMKGFSKQETITAVANLSDEDVENTIAYLRASAW